MHIYNFYKLFFHLKSNVLYPASSQFSIDLSISFAHINCIYRYRYIDNRNLRTYKCNNEIYKKTFLGTKKFSQYLNCKNALAECYMCVYDCDWKDAKKNQPINSIGFLYKYRAFVNKTVTIYVYIPVFTILQDLAVL